MKKTEKFTGFKKETSDFFWEMRFNNDREWFYAHKEQYDALIGRPMAALAAEVTALMDSRFPEMGAELHLARIWRDARRLYGRGPLKESLWFTIKEHGGDDNQASFYFELQPATFTYGMGFWWARAEQSENFRKSVDANPAAFRTLAQSVADLGLFKLEGPLYSKPKGNYGEPIDSWYNRKWASLNHTEDFGGDLLREDFPLIMADRFEKIMPMYEYMMKFCI